MSQQDLRHRWVPTVIHVIYRPRPVRTHSPSPTPIVPSASDFLQSCICVNIENTRQHANMCKEHFISQQWKCDNGLFLLGVDICPGPFAISSQETGFVEEEEDWQYSKVRIWFVHNVCTGISVVVNSNLRHSSRLLFPYTRMLRVFS